jgi:hypothetical protein
MKKSFLFLCLSILVLAGCKKESIDVNRHVVSILVLPIESDGVSPAGYNYKLKAVIITPAGLEVQDHGFLVLGAGGTNGTLSVPLGSGKIAGAIESDFPSALPEGQFTIAAYAILKNGETIYSQGYTPTQPVGIPVTDVVSVLYPGYTPMSGFERFTGDAFNYDTTKYRVIEIGVDYATTPDFTSVGYTSNDNIPLFSNYVQTYIDLQIPTSSFNPGTPYTYRLYVIVEEIANPSATYKIISIDNSFTSQNP